MSSQMYDALNNPVPGLPSQQQGSVLRGIVTGFIPLGLLLLIGIITLLLTALARQLFASSGFFAQQRASIIVLIAGLLVALVVFIIAIVRILKQITSWQRDGVPGQARAALVALGCTALIVLLPVVLAIVLPHILTHKFL